MPAQKPYVGQSPSDDFSSPNLPEKKVGFYPSNFEWFSKILVPSTTLIISVIVVFFLVLETQQLSQKFIQNSNKSAQFTNFAEFLVQKIYQATDNEQIRGLVKDSFVKIASSNDKNEEYKQFIRVEAGVGLEYAKTHNPKYREFLESLNTFAGQNYPEMYKSEDFYVACNDEECGDLNYPAEIDLVRKMIEESELGLNKQPMLDALYSAAIAEENDVDRKFVSYVFVLALLQNESLKGNSVARELGNDLNNFVSEKFPDKYAQFRSSQDQFGGSGI